MPILREQTKNYLDKFRYKTGFYNLVLNPEVYNKDTEINYVFNPVKVTTPPQGGGTDTGTGTVYCSVNDYRLPPHINTELPNFVRVAVTDSYDNINWQTTFKDFSSHGYAHCVLSDAVYQVLSDTKMSVGGSGGTAMFYVNYHGAAGVEGTATTLKSEGCYRYFKPTPPEILSSMPDYIDVVPYMFMEEPDESQWYISSCGTQYWGGE